MSKTPTLILPFLFLALTLRPETAQALKIEVEIGHQRRISLQSTDNKAIKGIVIVLAKKQGETKVSLPLKLATPGEFTHSFGEKSAYTIYAYADGHLPQVLTNGKVTQDVTIVMQPDKSRRRYAVAWHNMGLMSFNPHGQHEFKSVVIDKTRTVWKLTPDMEGVTLETDKVRGSIEVKKDSKFVMTKDGVRYACRVIDSIANEYLLIEYEEVK